MGDDLITLEFGALATPLAKQLPQMPKKEVARFQAWSEAISTLRIVGLISSTEGDRAYHRLAKRIRAAARSTP